MLKGYGTGAEQKYEFGEKKKKLANALRDSAKANKGWLPNFKQPAKKEVEQAKRHLPQAKVGLMKNGVKHVVKLPNGISKGKSVEFTFNEKRNPDSMTAKLLTANHLERGRQPLPFYLPGTQDASGANWGANLAVVAKPAIRQCWPKSAIHRRFGRKRR